MALFGPTANKLKDIMHLTPVTVGFLVAMPSLSGSLLRIPFAAWVDTAGGRKPFLTLLGMTRGFIGPRLAGLGKQRRGRNPQRLGEFFDAFEGDVARASLNSGDVSAVQTGTFRQFLLGKPKAEPQASNGCPKAVCDV